MNSPSPGRARAGERQIVMRTTMLLNLEDLVPDLCSWCGRRLADREEVIPLGATIDLKDHERVLIGRAVEFSVDGYVITGFLFPNGSRGKEEGFDLGLIACSDDCADRAMECAGNRDIDLQPLTEATVRLKMMRA
jgi:hypothetical protein